MNSVFTICYEPYLSSVFVCIYMYLCNIVIWILRCSSCIWTIFLSSSFFFFLSLLRRVLTLILKWSTLSSSFYSFYFILFLFLPTRRYLLFHHYSSSQCCYYCFMCSLLACRLAGTDCKNRQLRSEFSLSLSLIYSGFGLVAPHTTSLLRLPVDA